MKRLSVALLLLVSIAVTGCSALKPIIDQMCQMEAVKKMSDKYTKACEPVEEVPAK